MREYRVRFVSRRPGNATRHCQLAIRATDAEHALEIARVNYPESEWLCVEVVAR